MQFRYRSGPFEDAGKVRLRLSVQAPNRSELNFGRKIIFRGENKIHYHGF